MSRKIKRALVSVFDKTGLERIIRQMHDQQIEIISTGGTKSYIENLGLPVTDVSALTGYPEIFGGRVKTLHPVVFGGILQRSSNPDDNVQAANHNIMPIDIVVVDLYPFEKTLIAGADHHEMIEKIDIGGVSLIRAAAKNFNDVLIIPSVDDYPVLEDVLKKKPASSTVELRRRMAGRAFAVTARYDSLIHKYLADESESAFAEVILKGHRLRYGENPHQRGVFYGDLNQTAEQLHGKDLSYNNLLDTHAALELIGEFEQCTCAIIKHNNACGVASAVNPLEAWRAALAADPVSAFGGIIVFNRPVELSAATEINSLFFEVLIAPGFSTDALDVLKQKKNRIILNLKKVPENRFRFQSALGGVLFQDNDLKSETGDDLRCVTLAQPSAEQLNDLLFALRVVKHTRSNAIVLVKDSRLISSGTGQTSRVDALAQAIEKAGRFGFSLQGAVMASDAFFPFPDCVEMAAHAGIKAIVQPGGSVKDQDSVDACNRLKIAMCFTGIRHFRH